MNIPEELKYTKEHEWIRREGEDVIIGITDYAQDQLGDIVFVELPEVDSDFDKGDEFGTLESTVKIPVKRATGRSVMSRSATSIRIFLSSIDCWNSASSSCNSCCKASTFS